jgi:hypothetical protein
VTTTSSFSVAGRLASARTEGAEVILTGRDPDRLK